MSEVQFIIRVDDSTLLDHNATLRTEVVEWLNDVAGQVKCDRRHVHFITSPPNWWYERHPRTDIGFTTLTRMAIQAEQTWDVFTFIDPKLALLFKLAWL